MRGVFVAWEIGEEVWAMRLDGTWDRAWIISIYVHADEVELRLTRGYGTFSADPITVRRERPEMPGLVFTRIPAYGDFTSAEV